MLRLSFKASFLEHWSNNVSHFFLSVHCRCNIYFHFIRSDPLSLIGRTSHRMTNSF